MELLCELMESLCMHSNNAVHMIYIHVYMNTCSCFFQIQTLDPTRLIFTQLGSISPNRGLSHHLCKDLQSTLRWTSISQQKLYVGWIKKKLGIPGKI